ncbi:MAG: type II toxin-antitoxin system VapC family toxin [Candidatus Bathyarchaeia archaeon]
MDKTGPGEKPRVIIDASVAVKWIIPGEPWEEQARILEERIAGMEVEAYAPTLLTYEVASVVWRAVAGGILKFDYAVEALEALGDLGLNLRGIDWTSTVEMLRVAEETGLTIYDSAYIYLSEKLDARLVTADRELKEKCEGRAEVILLGELA